MGNLKTKSKSNLTDSLAPIINFIILHTKNPQVSL